MSKRGVFLKTTRWRLFAAVVLLICGFAWVSAPTSKWQRGAPLHTARYDHCTVLLPDGRLLVLGGTGAKGQTLASCEIYNPASNSWSGAAPMADPRSKFCAHLLSDGDVFVIGEDPSKPTSAQVYTPKSDVWSAPQELPLGLNTNSPCPDGTLDAFDNFEITDVFGAHVVYNPISSKIQVIQALKGPSIDLQTRYVKLFAGPVLPVSVPLKKEYLSIEDGIYITDSKGAKKVTDYPYNSTDSYYGFYTTFVYSIPIHLGPGITVTHFGLVNAVYEGENAPFSGMAYVALPSGKVLGTGGMGVPPNWEAWLDLHCDRNFHWIPISSPGPDGTPFTEVLDLSGNKWRPTWPLANNRAYHSATLLSNGKVLVVGGREHGKALSSCEVIDVKELDP